MLINFEYQYNLQSIIPSLSLTESPQDENNNILWAKLAIIERDQGGDNMLFMSLGPKVL